MKKYYLINNGNQIFVFECEKYEVIEYFVRVFNVTSFACMDTNFSHPNTFIGHIKQSYNVPSLNEAEIVEINEDEFNSTINDIKELELKQDKMQRALYKLGLFNN